MAASNYMFIGFVLAAVNHIQLEYDFRHHKPHTHVLIESEFIL